MTEREYQRRPGEIASPDRVLRVNRPMSFSPHGELEDDHIDPTGGHLGDLAPRPQPMTKFDQLRAAGLISDGTYGPVIDVDAVLAMAGRTADPGGLREAAEAAANYRPSPDALMDGSPSGQELREWWFGWVAVRDALHAALASETTAPAPPQDEEPYQEAAMWAYQFAGALTVAYDFKEGDIVPLLDVLSSLAEGEPPAVEWPAVVPSLASEPTAPAPHMEDEGNWFINKMAGDTEAVLRAAEPAPSIPDDALRTDQRVIGPAKCPLCRHTIDFCKVDTCGCEVAVALATAPEPTLDATRLAEAIHVIRNHSFDHSEHMHPNDHQIGVAIEREAAQVAAEYARLRTGSDSDD